MRHVFIVSIVEIFCTSAFYGILMELCDSDLNRCILDVTGAHGVAEGLPQEQAGRYAVCMMLALEHLHGRSIIFRDLKPENVLLSNVAADAEPGDGGGDGPRASVAKLADFGLARLVRAQEAHPREGECGRANPSASYWAGITHAVGTPAFMAAEAFEEGILRADSPQQTMKLLVSRDWYGLGCCLMLMLLGELGGRKVQSRRGAVLLPPHPEEMVSVLECVIAKACATASSGGDARRCEALALVAALTAEVPAQRAASEEMRSSPFLQAAIQELEPLVQKHELGTSVAARARARSLGRRE